MKIKMVDEKQIKQWLKEGTITQAQAKKMMADSSSYKKEQSSNKLIVAISTIGAILLGIGAILFIASNWRTIPNIAKTLLLVGSTFGAYYVGYLFRYQKQNLPKVGASLIFLGALLFGATVFLIAQIYNINANSHTLMLIWMIGILPLVYVFMSMPIAGLLSLLFFIWVYLFFFLTSQSFFGWLEGFASRYFPVLYVVAGVMLFGIGGLHYLSEKLHNIARIYRIAGLKVILFSLFLLTFNFFSLYQDYYGRQTDATGRFVIGFVMFSVLAIIIGVINWFFNKSEQISKIEGPVSLGLMALMLVFYYYPSSTTIYVIIFNLVLAGVIFLLLYAGYEREDMKLVNMGMFWVATFIVVRYFDFFWGLLDRSIFFMVGGLILVLGGIALEKKRRQIKAQFKA